jgi:hypothetical protein
MRSVAAIAVDPATTIMAKRSSRALHISVRAAAKSPAAAIRSTIAGNVSIAVWIAVRCVRRGFHPAMNSPAKCSV